VRIGANKPVNYFGTHGGNQTRDWPGIKPGATCLLGGTIVINLTSQHEIHENDIVSFDFAVHHHNLSNMIQLTPLSCNRKKSYKSNKSQPLFYRTVSLLKWLPLFKQTAFGMIHSCQSYPERDRKINCIPVPRAQVGHIPT
jgi:hypothetical protein